MKKAVIFCSHGLGDGILFSLIANNLQNNGYLVDVYHDLLSQLNDLYTFNVQNYPKHEDIADILKCYDVIIINSDHLDINMAVKKHAQQYYPEKTFDLHPSTCKSKTFIGNYRFDILKTMNQNLLDFCDKNLNIKNIKNESGFNLSKNVQHKKYKNRVVIHPTSKDVNRNWPKEKFIKLSEKLKKMGFNPVFIIEEKDRSNFEEINSPIFSNLKELTFFIYESGYMIGNDSGVGHLASALKIPTLSIFITKRKKTLWKPDYIQGKTITGWSLINIKGLRLREKFWKNTISVKKVISKFNQLVEESI